MAEYKGSGPHSDEIPQTKSIPVTALAATWERGRLPTPPRRWWAWQAPTLVLRYDVCPLPPMQKRERERECVCVCVCVCVCLCVGYLPINN